MTSVQQKKEDRRLIQFGNQPGMTQVKRPKLSGVVQDGTIDLKRFLQSGADTSYLPASNPIANNRVRKASSSPLLPELVYAPNSFLNLLPHLSGHVEVRLPQSQLAAAAVHTKKRFIWGDKIYTADTDLFCALVHQAFLPCRCTDAALSWPSIVKDIRAILHIVKPEPRYSAVSRNGMRSRAWASPCFDCSFSVERAWIVLKSDESGAPNEVDFELDPAGPQVESARAFFALSQHDPRISTRQVANGGDRRRAKQTETPTVIYNLVNEPWSKYSATRMADTGFTFCQYTASKFQTHVLYLESETERFELCMRHETLGRSKDSPGSGAPFFRFACCLAVLPQDLSLRRGVPLPADCIKELFPRVAWEQLQWGSSTLVIAHMDCGSEKSAEKSSGKQSPPGMSIPLVRMHWLPRTKSRSPSQ